MKKNVFALEICYLMWHWWLESWLWRKRISKLVYRRLGATKLISWCWLESFGNVFFYSDEWVGLSLLPKSYQVFSRYDELLLLFFFTERSVSFSFLDLFSFWETSKFFFFFLLDHHLSKTFGSRKKVLNKKRRIIEKLFLQPESFFFSFGPNFYEKQEMEMVFIWRSRF